MSRMHSPKKGQSGSTRPHLEENPDWVHLDEEEIRELIVDLASKGETASQIGITLRDQYGVPDVELAIGNSITEVMEANDLGSEIPEDLLGLMEKAVNLKDHLEENPKDKANRRSLRLVESKIRRLVDYYKEQEKLEEDWRYSMDKAEILTQ
ncbi:MAG: 30S ribosomal protein S15 [Candidatus Thermoplasmatota archaeon]|nr:30S ribosomal protein S15 [Candidatus Thermoplasmatota archaeon]MBS3790256.1 30S ribosomal protein S15 [Candidatus Thermoplasmatota archaeon]